MRALLSLLIFASGCAGPLASLKVERPLTLESARFTIRSDGTVDADVHRIEHALSEAPAGLAPWGGLETPVTVFVVSDHRALERAVHRPGYAWLRAWARLEDVVVQAPSTWTTNAAVIDELLLHELTHCLLFQRTGTPESWRSKQIPLWFREGMAVWTAKQQGLYPTLEDTAQWAEKNPALDVFEDGEALSAEHYLEVYGFALHAFTFLERRYGAVQLGALMGQMKAGADFATGFEQAMGTTLARFQRDFLNYLHLRAFRGTGRSAPLLRPNLHELIEKRRPGA